MMVSDAFFNYFMNTVIEIYCIITSVLFIYWLRPFVKNMKSVYYAVVFEWITDCILRHVDVQNGIKLTISIFSLFFVGVILFYLDEKRNLMQKIFLCVSFFIIRWLSLEIFTELGFYERDFVFNFKIFRESIPAIVAEYVVSTIVEYGLALLLLFFSIKLLLKTYKNKHEELSWKELIMLLIPCISIFFATRIIYSYYMLWFDGIENGSIKANIPGNMYRILFCIMAYLTLCVTLYFYQSIKANKEIEYANRVLARQIEDSKQYVGQVDNVYQQMRALRHDTGNHMAVMKGLLETEKYQELRDYLGNWEEVYSNIVPSVKTGNVVTDIAISEFVDRFTDNGITLKTSLKYPSNVAVNPFEMCVVLTNAIQNAYEASLRVNEPYVEISSVERENVYIISIKNKSDKKAQIDEEGVPISIKNDDGHGFGVRNIREIARKYNGDIEIKQFSENDGLWFVLNIMFVG